MRNANSTTRPWQISVMLIAILALGGCAQTKSWMDNVRGGSRTTGGEAVILGAPDADEYLNELYALASGDPATQAELYADAEAAATLTPDPQSTLRFALALATPGHPETDATRAQSLLREILARPELLTPAEVALATIHLKSSERLMMLSAESERLRASSSRAARTEQQAMNQRLATVEAENRQLKRQLSEAEEKLEAITSIEQSIRAQDP